MTFVVNRRAAVLRVLLYFVIVFALGFAAGRVSAAPRSAAQITPATVFAETSGESEAGRLTGALQNVLQDGSGEHKAGAAELPARGHGEASPATESSAPIRKEVAPARSSAAVSMPAVRSRFPLAAGIASWFPSPGYTAALPSFRWGMRPYLVTVSGPAGSARVKIVSFCLCVVGGSRRAIDLSPAAFRAVCGPLSLGVCRVRLG